MGTKRTTAYDDKGNELVLPKGVYLNGKSLRIGFSYKGKYRKEKVPTTKISKTSIKHAEHLKIEICNKIEREDFNDKDYALYFPNSRYAKKISASNINPDAKTEDFIDEYVEFTSIGLQDGSKQVLNYSLRKCVKNNLPSSPSDINFTSLSKTKVALTKNYAPNTSITMLHMVIKYIKYLQKRGIVLANFDPTEIGTIARNEKSPDPFTLDEFKEMMNCQTSRRIISLDHSKLIFCLACYTGLRTGEMTALSRDDIDIKRGTLAIRRSYNRATKQFCVPKTPKSVREIVLQPPALKAILSLLEAKPHPYIEVDIYKKGKVIRADRISPLILNNSGGILDNTELSRRIKELMSIAGVRIRRPYQTRHTFACWNLTLHGNVAFIANQMGHSGFIELQRTYGKFMEEFGPDEARFIWKEMQEKGHAVDYLHR